MIVCPQMHTNLTMMSYRAKLLQLYHFLLPPCSSHVAVLLASQKEGWKVCGSIMHDTHTTTMTLSELTDHDVCSLQ